MPWNNTGYWMTEPPVLGRVKILFSKQQLNRGASFRWSFSSLSAWRSIESTTILTTHPSLICEYLKNLFCENLAKDMGGLEDFWMDNATERADFFMAKKD